MKFQNDIELILSKEIFQELKQCVEKARPNEACGIVFGHIKQEKKKEGLDDFHYLYIGEKFGCIKSDKRSTVSFLIENIEKLHETIQNMIGELSIDTKMRLISIFHSHPSGSYPSNVDLNNMKFLDNFSSVDHNFVSKAFKNLIWSIMDSISFEINCFIYLESELLKVNVKIDE
ncbi:MAG: Mov34/MPN/PAD-1 family protein [Promethearchaeota archaeon]